MQLEETAPLLAKFVDEVVDEALGNSHRKWALMLVCLAIGAAAALWFTRRSVAKPASDAVE